MRALLIAVAVLISAAPIRAAELYAAGKTIFRVDIGSAGLLATGTLDAQATDLAPDPRGRYLAATTANGLTLLDPDDLSRTGGTALGVLDAVETSVTGDTLYVLLHPGGDRRHPTGSHVLLALPHDDLAASSAIATLTSDSYDLFRSPDGNALLVTRLVGRAIDLVDARTRAVTRVVVDDGRERNGLAVLRAAAFDPGGGRLLVGESAKGLPALLWEVDLRTLAAVAHETTWVMHASDVLVAGDRVVMNGRDQLGIFDVSTGAPLERADLHRDAWSSIAARSGDVYLAAPAEDGGRVMHLAPGAAAADVAELIALPERVVRLALRPRDAERSP